MIKLIPEIPGQTQMDQRQAQRGKQVLPELADIFFAGADIQHRAGGGAIQKAEHRMIEFVVADADMIHVMREARDELMAGWSWLTRA